MPGPVDWRPIGWRSAVVAALIYSACVSAATWPRVTTFRTNLPELTDSVTHLWTLHWNRSALLEGRSPFSHPGLQAPIGAPTGLNPPMHLQTAEYLVASAITGNDVLCYNLIWFASFVGTGLGSAFLAWRIGRDRASALVAGLLAMLATPMMTHGYGHLELIQVGGFPIFLVAWIGFVDRPGFGRLMAASGSYLLVAASAPYFAVLAIYPAVLYGTWAGWSARREFRAWIGARSAWALAFVAVAGPGLAVLFSGQVWASIHGFAVSRPKGEFLKYGAPAWGYLVPTKLHRLGQLIPFDFYRVAGITEAAGERASYLGVVTLGLMAYAAALRLRFARASYWWMTLGLLVVLSLGAEWRVGGVRIMLPAGWGLNSASPLRLLRVPARFNLFAGVVAAAIASVGLKNLLGRIAQPWARAATVAAVMALALVDLAVVPFGSSPLPPIPGGFAEARKLDPGASFIEGPQFASGDAAEIGALGAYWQSIHGARTTAGYTAHPNLAFDGLIAHASPFSIWDLANPYFLSDPEDATVDLMAHVSYRDYAWLFLTRYDLRFVVLHKRPASVFDHPARLDRARLALQSALISDDAEALVFDRDRLPRPSRPVAVCAEGWRQTTILEGRRARSMARSARLAVFNPDNSRDLTLSLEASAFLRPRVVRLNAGDSELARWTVEPGPHREVESPSFHLPAGLGELTIDCDGDDPPTRHRDTPADGDRRPISLRVVSIGLRAVEVIAGRGD